MGSESVIARVAKFSQAVLAALWEGSDLDGEDIQTLALKHGLIVKTTFDPSRHVDHLGVGAERGDEWFVEIPELAALSFQGGDHADQP